MGVFDLFAKPKPQASILKEEDIAELQEIKRKAFMEKAREIMKERGTLEAKAQLELKKEKSGFV